MLSSQFYNSKFFKIDILFFYKIINDIYGEHLNKALDMTDFSFI